MPKMKLRLLIGTTAAACCLTLASASHASVTYSYLGNSLDTYVDSPDGVGFAAPYPVAGPLSISLTFANGGGSLLDWSVSQSSIGTISKLSAANAFGGTSPLISLLTSPTGQVTAWYVSVFNPRAPYNGSAYETSALSFSGQISSAPNTPGPGFAMDHAAAVGTGVLTYIAMVQNNPGNWQSNGALNSLSFYQGAISEPVASIPEPETYAMLIAGLAPIGVARRKSKA